jgi:hypothetical protein
MQGYLSGSAMICKQLGELTRSVDNLVAAVNSLPYVDEALVGLFIAGRLANSAGPSAVADSLIPQFVQLAKLVTDHCRADLKDQ